MMRDLLDRGLRVHVWIVATIIPLLDKFLTLEQLLKSLTPHRPFRPYIGVEPQRVAMMVHHRLQRPIYMRRRTCLRLSLVLYHFLQLAGVEAIFHVAVFPPSRDPRRLHAHGWVTVGKECLSEPPDEKAAEILTYGRDGAITKP